MLLQDQEGPLKSVFIQKFRTFFNFPTIRISADQSEYLATPIRRSLHNFSSTMPPEASFLRSIPQIRNRTFALTLFYFPAESKNSGAKWRIVVPKSSKTIEPVQPRIMVLRILRWAYLKYKIYCFVSCILLILCLIGYLGLAWYWIRKLIRDVKKKKKEQPASRRVTRKRIRTTAATTRKTEEPLARAPRRADMSRKSTEDMPFSPSPLNERGLPKRPRRRRYDYDRYDYDADYDIEGPPKRTVTSEESSFGKPPKKIRKVSDRLKETKPQHKQYLFVWSNQDCSSEEKWTTYLFWWWRALMSKTSIPKNLQFRTEGDNRVGDQTRNRIRKIIFLMEIIRFFKNDEENTELLMWKFT